jgi:hypothetical protein
LLSIGITGHRSLRQIPLVKIRIHEILLKIDHDFQEKDWQIFSLLAEGADRLVVHATLQFRPNTRLIIPLPLPIPKYINDFSSEESKNEFFQLLGQAFEIIEPVPASTRSRAYLSAGIHMLDRINVLIALWDGKNASKIGGTSNLVDLARQRNLPIAWLHCGNGIHQDKNQGNLKFENFHCS